MSERAFEAGVVAESICFADLRGEVGLNSTAGDASDAYISKCREACGSCGFTRPGMDCSGINSTGIAHIDIHGPKYQDFKEAMEDIRPPCVKYSVSYVLKNV